VIFYLNFRARNEYFAEEGLGRFDFAVSEQDDDFKKLHSVIQKNRLSLQILFNLCSHPPKITFNQ